MRKLLMLAVLLFCVALTAAADDPAVDAVPSLPSDAPAAPASSTPADYSKWQLAAGFQYQHYKVYGLSFPNYGFSADVTRALNKWGSLEGMVGFGFGNASGPVNPDAKSLFLGGGPRLTMRDKSKFEPWMHVLVGLDHIRFTQAAAYGTNSALAFLGGGGFDYKFKPRLSWRVEADYLGTRFQTMSESNYSVGTGIVFNF
jgi:hypothetical protein